MQICINMKYTYLRGFDKITQLDLKGLLTYFSEKGFLTHFSKIPCKN